MKYKIIFLYVGMSIVQGISADLSKERIALASADYEWMAHQPHQEFVYVPDEIKECVSVLVKYDGSNILLAACIDIVEVLEHNMHVMPLESAQRMIECCRALLEEHAQKLTQTQARTLKFCLEKYQELIGLMPYRVPRINLAC